MSTNIHLTLGSYLAEKASSAVNEVVASANGWRQLARFMAKHPDVFPKVEALPNGTYSVEDCTPVNFDANAAKALKGFGDEMGEDDGRMPTEKYLDEDVQELLAALEDVVYSRDEEVRAEVVRLGIESAISANSIMRDSSGKPRFVPFGRQFGGGSWAAKTNMIPPIGSGKDQVAALGKNGWVLKTPKVPFDLEEWRARFEHMKRHPGIFAGVRNFRPQDGRYWQEKLDEQAWERLFESDPERSEEAYGKLEEAFYATVGAIAHLESADNGGFNDFSQYHNVGLNKEGEPRIYDF